MKIESKDLNDFEEKSKSKFDKEVDTLKVDCQRCGVVNHTLLHSEKIPTSFGNEEYQIVQCKGCDRISFRRVIITKDTNSDGLTTSNENIDLYPNRIVGHQKLKLDTIPKTIIEIYEEIYSALSNRLLVLATIGMRSVIEAVCNDLNPKTKGKNLKSKIDDLVDMQTLTKKNANNLHKLRDFGNAAAHEVSIPTEEILNKCMNIIEHLLIDVYSEGLSN